MKNLGKKLLLTAMTTSLVLTSAVGLTACFGNNNPTTQNKAVTAKDVFSMAAVSSVSYLGDTNVQGAGLAANEQELTRPSDITDETVDSLKTYLGMFNKMLANGGFNTVTGEPTAEENAELGVDYASKIVVDVDGEKYAIYYNETTIGDTEKDVDPDDDDDEITEETSLTGVLVKGDEKYEVVGGRKNETELPEEEGESAEVEKSVWFETTNDNGKVKVEQKHETEDGEESISYEYTIYDAEGNEVTNYEIEWEVEDGKTEMEVSITDALGNETEFEVEAKSETKLVITKEVETNSAETETVINVTKINDTTYEFKYANNFTETVTIEAQQPEQQQNDGNNVEVIA